MTRMVLMYCDLVNIKYHLYCLTEIPTMDLKDLSPVSMSAVLIFGIWKASSFSLSRFMLELSLSVSESTAAWFGSFTPRENILQPTETSLRRPASASAGRKGERGGKKMLNQPFSLKYFYYFGVSSVVSFEIDIQVIEKLVTSSSSGIRAVTL